MVFPAIAQMPVGNPIYGTDAYGNPVDANGNPVQLDANGNPIVDGYGNDAYTWGRDTTQAEEKNHSYRFIRLEYRRTLRQHHSRRRGHAAEQFPELQPDGRPYGTIQLSGKPGFSPACPAFSWTANLTAISSLPTRSTISILR